MKIQLLDDRIIVEPISNPTTTPSGLVLTAIAQQRPVTGKVKFVGPGLRKENGDRIPMVVKIGDTVMFGLHTGTELKIEDAVHLMMREAEVIAVMEDCGEHP